MSTHVPKHALYTLFYVLCEWDQCLPLSPANHTVTGECSLTCLAVHYSWALDPGAAANWQLEDLPVFLQRTDLAGMYI